MWHWGFLLRDHLHRAFIIYLLRCGSRGCGDIFSVVGILIFLFILAIFSQSP
jgi:hypothetical protein